MKGVVGKVALGEADAGFVYVTDARAAAAKLKSIPIPTLAQPKVRYEIAVVAHEPQRASSPPAPSWPGVLSPTGEAAPARAAASAPAVRRASFTVLLVAATVVALAFLLLPIVALFLRVPPGELSRQLGERRGVDALRVTPMTNAHRVRADPRRRHAGRLLARHPPLPRPRAG